MDNTQNLTNFTNEESKKIEDPSLTKSLLKNNEESNLVDGDNKNEDKGDDFKTLIAQREYIQLPKVGDIVKGKVISAIKNEIKLDIDGIIIGVVRGREIFQESDEYTDLKVGDEIEATVLELENENGELELSFRHAGHQKAWDNLRNLKQSQTPVKIKITEANKGGLIGKLGHTSGFLPVSQLSPENYPRVPGGDKGKILEKLRQFINKELTVKVMDIDEKEEKLIFSEKAARLEIQKEATSNLKVGEKIDGHVTAVTDFGVFVEFGDHLEGLVHISEIAWQRINDPRDFVKVGDKVEAEIISIDGSKIFLSLKKLKENPWLKVGEKYKVGDVVKGTVLKVNPYGLFVRLDDDIHGLAHISELKNEITVDPKEVAKSGDELEFKIVSLEPENYRLGLSLRQVKL